MSTRFDLLGSVKLDIEQTIWSGILDLCVEDYNPKVPELWDELLQRVVTPIRPKRTRNLTPSLLFSLAVAKAVEIQAWKTIPHWTWQQTRKEYSQHNVHLDGMKIAGVGEFKTGTDLKEWLRDQCAGRAVEQFLPTDRDLSMGSFVLTVGHHMREILDLDEISPDKISLRFSIRRDRVEKLLEHFGVECADGNLSRTLIVALKQAQL